MNSPLMMSSSPDPDFRLISHEGFDEGYDELGEENQMQIELALMEIRASPRNISRFMQAKYEGHREYTRDSHRVIFAICPECISHDYIGDIDCDDCEEIHSEDQADPQPVIKLIHLENIEPVRRAG